MGRSITIHVEIRVRGKWLHYDKIPLLRGSAIFDKMAEVGAGDDGWRGLPPDATETTLWDFGKDQATRETWLSAAEAATVEKWYAYDDKEVDPLFGDAGAFGFIDMVDDPREIWDGLEDARVVFWFDQ